MGSNSGFLLRVLYSLLLVLFLKSVRSCLEECGGIKIMYPFGVGEGCYMEKWYEIECDTGIPILSQIKKEVVNISLPTQFMSLDSERLLYGSIRIRNQIASKGCSIDEEELPYPVLNLRDTPFYVSQRNTLVAVGCNNKASLTNVEPSIVGCKSSCDTKGTNDHTPTKDYLALVNCNNKYGYDNDLCDEKSISKETSCNGNKCCTALMPDRIQQIVGVEIDNKTTTRGCNVAFLSDEAFSSSNISDSQLIYAKRYSTVELGWFIYTSSLSNLKSLGCSDIKSLGDIRSEQRKHTRCVCDYNAYLSYARCSCYRGYEGNPYVLHGCKDIDECQRKRSDGNPQCRSGTCVNTEGNYKCVQTNRRPLVIGLGTSLGSMIFVSVMYWLYKIVRKQRKLNQKKKFFKRNGGLLLQQQLTSTEGNVEQTKVFSSKELEKATENFSSNRILGQGGQGTVYKGMLVDGRIVAVKKSKVVDEDNLEEFINEVVILSQINHRNIVKLLGCCLDTNVPLLVYEFISNGNLSDYLHNEDNDNMMATWEVRLRIAVDIAGALSYLHSSASSPIYHRDVKTTNIMLDEKYRAKVSDFGTSRSVTVDHTHLTTVVSGTMGYMDPEYFQSSQYTDKSDVYSFGVVLAELIAGQRSISYLRSQENRTLATYFTLAMKENKLFDIIDVRIRDNCILDQVTATAKIARKCLSLKGKKRPSMREVSMELEKIRLLSGDTQPQENVSDKEEEIDKATLEDNKGPIEFLDNTFVTAPASQYEIVAVSSSSLSDGEPLFPHQTR